MKEIEDQQQAHHVRVFSEQEAGLKAAAAAEITQLTASEVQVVQRCKQEYQAHVDDLNTARAQEARKFRVYLEGFTDEYKQQIAVIEGASEQHALIA